MYKIIALIISGFLVLLSTLSTSNAQQSPLTTLFTPINGDLKTNEEKIIKLTLSSENKISALDLNLQTTGGLRITDIRNNLETNPPLDPFDYEQIRKNLEKTTTSIGYIFKVPTANLPKSITLYMKIQGSTTGEGKIAIDYNNSQILDGSGSLLQLNPNSLTASYSLNLSQSSPNFINLASIPATDYPDSAARINIRLKLFGALANANAKLKGTAVAVGRVGDSKYETQVQNLDLTPSPDGLIYGFVAFPDFKDGTKFSLMIKVDKYLLKRICNVDASESKPAGYTCIDPALTIKRGLNNFDFSGLSLLPGDLGLPDGVLNGYDLSIVRNNLNKQTREAVSLADLNYDGLVDEKDLSIIKFVAGSTSRKADQ